MSLTTRMLTAAGAGTVLSTDNGQLGPVNGVLKPQRFKDKSGIFQAAMNAGQTVTLSVQGRMDVNGNWFTITTITNTEMTLIGENTAAKVITIYPEMRVKSVQSAGAAPVIDAWITE